MAEYSRTGSIAFITINNPPVNALSFRVRKAIADYIARAESDRSVSCVVLYGHGNKFLAGADIREFGGAFGEGPNLTQVCDIIEACKKPVIAAIERFALGGGLEVAIASHYRVAHANTTFGFPEVDLGILPAAAGTQRFPRLVGLKAALEYIPTGQRFSAKKAKEIGLVDKVVEKDLLQTAVKLANEVSKKPLADRRASKLPVRDRQNAQKLYEAAAERASRKTPGLLAPVFAIKAVMASISGSFEEGLEQESKNAMVLFSSGQARALQYAFFAERAASQWSLPDGSNFKTTKPRPIRSIGIIGAGTMGTGIAMNALNCGLIVHLIEQNDQLLEKGLQLLKSLYAGSVSLGKMSQAEVQKNLGNLKATISYEPLRDVDLVVEAVYEDLKLKQEIFAKLDTTVKADAILCTNTSGLSIDKIASATKHPERVIGTHFFVPAYYMKLLENVRGQKTSPVAIATATSFGHILKKIPVLDGNCDGFVGNRMQAPYSMEAMFLVEEGCNIEDVDQVAENFGMPIGIFKVFDLSGIDVGASRMRELAKAVNVEVDETTRYFGGARKSALGLLLYKHKRFGRKTGKGWYDYERPGAKTPFPSDFVKDLIVDYRRRHGIPQRKITPQEITERLFYCLINEGFKILEEGIARKPEEIDTIWLHGYGWPRQTGGPMFYASTVGLENVYSRILEYHKQHVTSPHWKPSTLLERLAKQNIPLPQWHTQIAATTSRL